MKSKNIFFIFLIFLINFVSSATLSMSPSQIDFVGNIKEEICQKVIIKVNGTEVLTGKTKWAEENYFERKLIMHKLDSKEKGLEIFLPEILEISEKQDIDVCIKGNNPGKFHGVLLYKIENKPVQVGIWMNVSLEGNSLVKITGNFVKSEGESSRLYLLSIILLGIFLGLIVWYKKRIS